MPDKIRILFVVVLYGQVYERTNVYKSLLSNVDSDIVWIWDNSESHTNNAHLLDKPINYIYSKTNVGLSIPYNRANEYAIKRGFNWMVLLDQDTIFDSSFIDTLIASIRKHPEMKVFCPRHRLSNGLWLSPTKLHLKSTCPAKERVSGVIDIKHFAIINSGLVIDIETFKKAGGYNEAVFLDYSDFQFMDQLSKIETKAYCIDSVCVQDFSNDCVDANKLLNRFSLFCKSLRGIRANSLKDNWGYKLVVIKRCVSLMIRLNSFRPFYILIKDYLQL